MLQSVQGGITVRRFIVLACGIIALSSAWVLAQTERDATAETDSIAPLPNAYAHQFVWHKEPDEEDLRLCLAEMSLILFAAHPQLAGPDGRGDPVIHELTIQFNGQGDNGGDPFDFPGQDGANYCRTGRKPYDDVVVACLLVARDHFSTSTLEIVSSGSARNFVRGEQIYQLLLRRQPPDLFGRDGDPWWINLMVPAMIVGILVWVFRRV